LNEYQPGQGVASLGLDDVAPDTTTPDEPQAPAPSGKQEQQVF
jgi:hypothetical protein